MSHINIPAPRLERLIRILDLRTEGRKQAEIAAILRVHPQTVSSDYSILSVHTREELQRRLTALQRARRPAAPQRSASACLYTVVRDGRAQRCGRTCKGQYCDEHRRATLPAAGQYVPMTAHVYLGSGGGRTR